jgi:uncharacterized peroxidase-related enzyme
MTRLKNVSVEAATGPTKGLYEAVQKKLGTVPNLFQGIGSSHAALKAYLEAGEALSAGSLSFAEREAVALAVSQVNECNYCLAAHTALGKMAGIRDDEMIAIRKPGVASSKLQVLGGFARAVVQKRGYVSDDELEQVKEAGYTDAAVTEAIMVIALTTFTNFFNHVNKTVVDFPAAPGL